MGECMVIYILTRRVVRWTDVTSIALNTADPEYIAVWLHPGHGAMRAVQMNRLLILQ